MDLLLFRIPQSHSMCFPKFPKSQSLRDGSNPKPHGFFSKWRYPKLPKPSVLPKTSMTSSCGLPKIRRCTSIPCLLSQSTQCTIVLSIINAARSARQDMTPVTGPPPPMTSVEWWPNRTWMAPFVSAAQKVLFQKPKRDVELDGLFPRHVEYLSDFFCCPVDVHWHWWTWRILWIAMYSEYTFEIPVIASHRRLPRAKWRTSRSDWKPVSC